MKEEIKVQAENPLKTEDKRDSDELKPEQLDEIAGGTNEASSPGRR